MPVVNLPQDTRWGDIGKGLGSLIGSVAAGALTKYNDDKVSAGVAGIMADPAIPENQRANRALKDFGDAGYKKYQELLQGQVLQSQIKDHLAHTGLQTMQADAQRMKNESYMKEHPEQSAAELADLKAKTAAEQARSALVGAQTEAAAASAAKTRATTEPEAELLTQQGSEAGQRAHALFQQNMQTATGTAPDFSVMTAPYNLTPEEKATWTASLTEAYRAAKPGTGAAAAETRLRSLATAGRNAEKLGETKPIDTDSAKTARTSSEHAAVLEKFAKVLEDKPGDFGLLSGAGLKARLDRMGIPVGDPELLTGLETQKQLAASQAKSGLMFISAQTIALGRDISPNVDRSPLSNWKAIDAIATQKIAEVQSEIDRYADVTPKRQVKPLTEALERWKAIQAITNTIKTSVSADGAKTAMFFRGKQVDPFSFTVLVDPEKTYDLGGGKKATGATLFAKGAEAGKDPATALDEYRRQYGYTGKR